MTATVLQAYRFALNPSPAQARNLERHAGAARFAFNWALAAVKANTGQRNAERSYGIGGDDLTPTLGWTLPALRRAWNQAKGQAAPWWSECSKESFNTGLDGCARALKNWSESRSGKRAGRKVGFPRFKVRRRTTPSVRFTTGVIRVESDRKHVTLPRVGTMKTHESTRKLARRLGAGTAARREVTRIHTRVANLRKDAIHKLTTDLATTYGTVVVEDLNVAGMLKTRTLARHIADASFGEIRRQLDYKTGWNGGRLAVADRWFPSSKTCSGCGMVKPELSLRDRTFTCDTCGLVLDRDHNAAINLKQYVDLEWPGDAKTGRGADQKTGADPAGGCETPTPHRFAGPDGDRRLATVGGEK